MRRIVLQQRYEKAHRITVGELRERLSLYSDDTEVTIGPTPNGEPVVFNRLKGRGEKLVQIELAEAAVMMSDPAPGSNMSPWDTVRC